MLILGWVVTPTNHNRLILNVDILALEEEAALIVSHGKRKEYVKLWCSSRFARKSPWSTAECSIVKRTHCFCSRCPYSTTGWSYHWYASTGSRSTRRSNHRDGDDLALTAMPGCIGKYSYAACWFTGITPEDSPAAGGKTSANWKEYWR